MYTLPDNFMGNSVNVTITTSNSSDGAGDLYVNNVLHTFAAGETYTWTVPVTTGGTIEVKANAMNDFTNTFSPDFTSMVISSGNGSPSGAPTHHANMRQKGMIQDFSSEPVGKSKREQNIKITVK